LEEGVNQEHFAWEASKPDYQRTEVEALPFRLGLASEAKNFEALEESSF